MLLLVLLQIAAVLVLAVSPCAAVATDALPQWTLIPSLGATSYVGRSSIVTIPVSSDTFEADPSVTSRVIIAFETSPSLPTPGASNQLIYVSSALVVSNGSVTTMLDAFSTPTPVSSQPSWIAGTMWAPALHYEVTSKTLYCYYSVETTTDANGGGILNVVVSNDLGVTWSSPVAIVGVEGYIESGVVTALSIADASASPSWAFMVISTPTAVSSSSSGSSAAPTPRNVFVVRCVDKQSGIHYDISSPIAALSTAVATTGGTIVEAGPSELAVVVFEGVLKAAFTSDTTTLMSGWSPSATLVLSGSKNNMSAIVSPMTFAWKAGSINGSVPTAPSFDTVAVSLDSSVGSLGFHVVTGMQLTSSVGSVVSMRLPLEANTSIPNTVAPLPINSTETALRPSVVVIRCAKTNKLYVGVVTLDSSTPSNPQQQQSSDAKTAIAITFSIVGVVIVALAVVFFSGKLRAKNAEGAYLLPPNEADSA